MNKLLLSLPLLLLASCFQTVEEIKREERVSQVDQELQQSRVHLAEMTSKQKELQDQVNLLNGRLEEYNHKQGQLSEGQISQIAQLLTAQKTEIEDLKLQVNDLQEKLKIQTAYLQEVTKGLDHITGSKSSKKSKKNSKNEEKSNLAPTKGSNQDFQSKINLVEQHLKAGKLDEAKSICESIVQDSAYSEGKHNQCRFKLGEVAYKKKNYEDALVYFSKIYTRWPKSSLAPESLFQIAKIFKDQGKKAEAKAAVTKLQSEYPKHPVVDRGLELAKSIP